MSDQRDEEEDDRGKKDPQEPSTNTRKFPRVDFYNPVKVRVSGENAEMEVFAGNVSEGGMFLRSNQPLEPGKKVTLEFDTERGPVSVKEGKVVWNKLFEPINVDGSPAGMGIEFKEVEPESQLKIDTLIEEALLGTPKPKTPLAPPTSSPPVESPSAPRGPVLQGQPTARSPAPSASSRPSSLSGLPSLRTRLLLLAGFSLLVAAGFFVFLMVVFPDYPPAGDSAGPESPVEESEAAATAPAAALEKPAAAAPEPAAAPEKPAALAPEPAAAPEKPAAAAPEPAAAPEKPAALAPEPAAAPENPAALAPEPAAAPENPAALAPEPAAAPENPAAAAVQPKAVVHGAVNLLPPQLRKVGQTWQLEIAASSATRFNHFVLTNPARMVIDAVGAVYDGKIKLGSPAPFIQQLRFGRQPDAVRLVVDFSVKGIPPHTINKQADRIIITFTP